MQQINNKAFLPIPIENFSKRKWYCSIDVYNLYIYSVESLNSKTEVLDK